MNKGRGFLGNEKQGVGRRSIGRRLYMTLMGLVLSGLLVACGQAQIAAPEVQPGETTDQRMLAESKLTAPRAQERGFFGDSLAISGDTLVIGSWGQDAPGEEAGAAYVFVRAAKGWQLQAELRASDAGAEHRFAHAVAIDGDTIAVGAIYHDRNGYQAGAVYLFERHGQTWTERAILTPDDATDYQYFGTSVALEKSTLVVGAGGFAGRAAYVFERNGTRWSQTAKLQPAVVGENDRFGRTVALSGNIIAVGAWNDAIIDEDEEYDDGEYEEGEYDYGEYGDAEPLFASDTLRSGTVHIFTRSGATWSRGAVLTPGGELRQGFGWSLDLHKDTLVVGAPELEDYLGMGTAYVFKHDDDAWSLQATLSPVAGPDFGWSVAVDQNTILVGAPGEDDNAGAAYVFHRHGNTWQEARRVHAPEVSPDLHFGSAVTLSGGRLVFGATGDRAGGVASGAVYVYH